MVLKTAAKAKSILEKQNNLMSDNSLMHLWFINAIMAGTTHVVTGDLYFLTESSVSRKVMPETFCN